jgi:hypothetical protein
VTEANTEESLVEMMAEIGWHRRETRRQTEKTNIGLRFRLGEIPEGLPGSLAPGMGKEKRRELERSHRFLEASTRYADNEPRQGKPGNGSKPKPKSCVKQVRLANPTEGGRKAVGKSDWPIVLGGGKASHRGKGPAVLRSLQRKHKPGVKDWTNLCKPHCGE